MNESVSEKRYLQYGSLKVSRNLGNILGLRDFQLRDFEKSFGKVVFEIEIVKKKDQETTYNILGLTLGKRNFRLVEDTGD